MSLLMKFLTFKRFVFYGFPIYLVLADLAMRFLINFAPGRHEEISIVAASNSIAAAGLALIAPVLIPKPMKSEVSALTQAEFRAAGLDLIGSNDRRLISSAYIGLLVLPFFWGAALWYAHDGTGLHDVSLWGFSIPTPVAIAIGIYLIGMIYTELKEIV
jgi:hypothetical protein